MQLQEHRRKWHRRRQKTESQVDEEKKPIQRFLTKLFDASRRDKSDDIFLSYGVGIASYFKLQKGLISLFVVLSILASIQMLLFSQIGGLSYIEKLTGMYALTSLGNMGFAKRICAKQTIDIQGGSSSEIQLLIDCEMTTSVTEVVDSGVLISEGL